MCLYTPSVLSVFEKLFGSKVKGALSTGGETLAHLWQLLATVHPGSKCKELLRLSKTYLQSPQ